MVDTGILATTQEVQDRVGYGASATANVEAYINRYVAQAEAQLNAETEYNWCDIYSTLNTDVKGIVSKAVACLTAIDVLAYDPGLFDEGVFNNKINILRTLYQDCVKILREVDKGQIFVVEA